jgi:hypothetical protein
MCFLLSFLELRFNACLVLAEVDPYICFMSIGKLTSLRYVEFLLPHSWFIRSSQFPCTSHQSFCRVVSADCATVARWAPISHLWSDTASQRSWCLQGAIMCRIGSASLMCRLHQESKRTSVRDIQVWDTFLSAFRTRYHPLPRRGNPWMLHSKV